MDGRFAALVDGLFIEQYIQGLAVAVAVSGQFRFAADAREIPCLRVGLYAL